MHTQQPNPFNVRLDNGIRIRGSYRHRGRGTGDLFVSLIITCPEGFILANKTLTIRKLLPASEVTLAYIAKLKTLLVQFKIDQIRNQGTMPALRKFLPRMLEQRLA